MVQVGYLPSTQALPNATKIDMGCPVAEIISHAKFQIDRFRGFRAQMAENSTSPLQQLRTTVLD